MANSPWMRLWERGNPAVRNCGTGPAGQQPSCIGDDDVEPGGHGCLAGRSSYKAIEGIPSVTPDAAST